MTDYLAEFDAVVAYIDRSSYPRAKEIGRALAESEKFVIPESVGDMSLRMELDEIKPRMKLPPSRWFSTLRRTEIDRALQKLGGVDHGLVLTLFGDTLESDTLTTLERPKVTPVPSWVGVCWLKLADKWSAYPPFPFLIDGSQRGFSIAIIAEMPDAVRMLMLPEYNDEMLALIELSLLYRPGSAPNPRVVHDLSVGHVDGERGMH